MQLQELLTVMDLTVPDHRCFENLKDSPGIIETDIIVDGFKKSFADHKLIYEYVIADGGSSARNSRKLVSPLSLKVTT